MYIKDQHACDYHANTYGTPLEYEYAHFVPKFRAENFNAKEWAAFFKEAGAQYAGPGADKAKNHDP